jgi:hypothetical protein
MSVQLQSRDVLLLLDVYKYRYLAFSQLLRLHFPSQKTAYRRLHALTSLDYVKAFHVPTIPERIFYLDKAGAEVVAGELNVAVEELKWYRYIKAPKDYNFLRHFLAINCRRTRTSGALPGNGADFCARIMRMTRDAYLRTAAFCLRISPPT